MSSFGRTLLTATLAAFLVDVLVHGEDATPPVPDVSNGGNSTTDPGATPENRFFDVMGSKLLNPYPTPEVVVGPGYMGAAYGPSAYMGTSPAYGGAFGGPAFGAPAFGGPGFGGGLVGGIGGGFGSDFSGGGFGSKWRPCNVAILVRESRGRLLRLLNMIRPYIRPPLRALVQAVVEWIRML